MTATAVLGGVSKNGSATVIVSAGAFDRVLISPATVILNIGGRQHFSVQVVDASGNSITGATISWEAPVGVGTISADGLLTAGTIADTFDPGVTATATWTASPRAPPLR